MDKFIEHIESIPFINKSFKVTLDDITGELLSFSKEKGGLRDDAGNYFYLREISDKRYTNSPNFPRKIEIAQRFRLVFHVKSKSEMIHDIVIAKIIAFKDKMKIKILNGSTDVPKIVRSEYPNKQDRDFLKNLNDKLISIDIEAIYTVYENQCEINCLEC